MSLMSVLSLSVGISLFMFGMLLIKYSLEKSFREKIVILFEKFTKNRFSCMLTGILVTFALQSSSASSVLTAAFTDSGILTLRKAFFIIVGANIGTTFTGLFTAFSFTRFAEIFCLAGIIILIISKSAKMHYRGILFTGLGILFVGMNTMSEASLVLKDSPFIYETLKSCSSAVTGILVGCFFTALIQSSSATTALLQTLAFEGIIGIRHAFYIILGSNIGTCATCAVSCIGLDSNAKKVSLMHIIYNLAGTVIFAFIAEFLPLPEVSLRIFPDNVKAQIAFLNILFNVLSAVIFMLLPLKRVSNSKKSKLILRNA